MKKMLLGLWTEEAGAVVTADLVLVLTVAVLGTIAGVGALSAAINTELEDLAEAIGALNQGYEVGAIETCHASFSSQANNDDQDACDCDAMELCNHVDAGLTKSE